VVRRWVLRGILEIVSSVFFWVMSPMVEGLEWHGAGCGFDFSSESSRYCHRSFGDTLG